MTTAATARRPFLTRGEYGFIVTDGATLSFPCHSFEEAREALKVATVEGIEAVGDFLYGDEATAEADYLAEQEAELAYARMLEARSERGSWFGYGD